VELVIPNKFFETCQLFQKSARETRRFGEGTKKPVFTVLLLLGQQNYPANIPELFTKMPSLSFCKCELEYQLW
jgi:hypothetical protein